MANQPAVAASVYEFLRTGKTDGLPTQVDMAPVVFAKPDFAPPADFVPPPDFTPPDATRH